MRSRITQEVIEGAASEAIPRCADPADTRACVPVYWFWLPVSRVFLEAA
jgi:hypothetical protein